MSSSNKFLILFAKNYVLISIVSLLQFPTLGMGAKINQNLVQNTKKETTNGLILKRGTYFYRVQKDDFLDFIATRFYGTKKAGSKILSWNNLKDPRKLFVGKLLVFKERPINTKLEDSQKALFFALARKFKLSEQWAEQSLAASLRSKDPKAKKSEQTIATKAKVKEENQEAPSDQQPSMSASLNQGSAITESLNKDPEFIIKLIEPSDFWKSTFDALDSKMLAAIGERLYQEKKFFSAAQFLRSARQKSFNLGKSWLLEYMSLQECNWKGDMKVTKSEFESSALIESIKTPLLQKMNQEGPIPAESCTLEELKTLVLGAEDQLAAGEGLFSANKKEFALTHLKDARTKNTKLVKAWILEIRCYRDLQKSDAADATIAEFKQQHPGLAQLPFLRR